MERASETASPSIVQYQPLAAIPSPKAPLLPQAQNFAFAVRMLGLESPSRPAPLAESAAPAIASQTSPGVTANQTSLTQTNASVSNSHPSNLAQPAQPATQTSGTSQKETPVSSTDPQKSDTITQKQPDLLKVQETAGVTTRWNDAVILQAPEVGPTEAMAERTQAPAANLPLAAQETHLAPPELPRTSAGSEILLHLAATDQSSAAIRVADRAGTVSVSVHASDPVLRESLRSNLGELSTLLNSQGWKADVFKSAAAAMHSDSQPDSHPEGQRGSQQQFSGSDRQPHRDRRSNGGQWQQELDQQISGGDALSGGNR